MLPSLANADALLDALRGTRGFFGEKLPVWSWSEMYSNLIPPEDLRRQIDPPDHRLILKFILDRNIGELDARGVGVPGGVRRGGFIDILSAALRELLLEGVPPDMLLREEAGSIFLSDLSASSALSDLPEHKNSKNSEVFITPGDLLYRLYSDYLLYLDENGLADNSQLPSLLADYISRHPIENTGPDLCWVGFLSLTGSQLRLVRILREQGQRMEFFVPDAGLENFRDLSKQFDVPKAPLAGDTGMSVVVTLSASDMYEQYDGTAREIALAMSGDGPLSGACAPSPGDSVSLPDVGVLVPREKLSLMASALERYGIPHQSRSETPVSETRIIEMARMAWEAYSLGWPARRTLNLLKSAFALSGAVSEKFPQLFNGGSGSLMPPDGLDAWIEALAGSRESLALFERLNSFCQFLDDPDGHVPSEILGALLDLCGEDWEERVALCVGDDASMDFALRELSSSRLEIAQKIELIGELIPSIGPAGERRFSGADAVGFLTDWSREAATALSQPLRGAVALYDAPPPVLVSHRLWVMTDVDSSRFPGASADHPLLDGTVRESVNREGGDAVHLPTMREKREQSEALFRRLVALGEEATLIVRSARDSRGREQGESTFLSALFADPASGALRADELSCAFDPLLAGGQISRGVFPRSAEVAGGLGSEARRGAPKLRVASSSIDELIDCPFSYWCGHIARLEPPPGALAAPGAFDRLFQGNVAHELWGIFWDAYLERGAPASLTSILAEEWGGALARLAVKYPELGDPRSRSALNDLRDAMSRAAAAQDDVESRARDAGFVREKTEFEYCLPVIEFDNVIFTGKADRIDVWRNIGFVIMDYKLGKSGKYKDSLQLAAYAAMLRESGENVAGFGYVGHRDGRIRGSWTPEVLDVYKGGAKTKDAGVEEKISDALDAMSGINSMVGSGAFTANYASGSCAACQWGTICRRAETYRVMELDDEDDRGDEENVW
jgi:RecB family exonuclease